MDLAKDDETAAEACLEKRVYRMTCWHSQQLAEKALKAFLLKVSRRIPKTHDLGRLIKRCAPSDASFSALRGAADALKDYYMRRYGDHPAAITWRPQEPEAREALVHARKIRDHVAARL